jgi:hypothetical protein
MPAYFGYWMLLSNGVIVPYGNWADLEINACRAFHCSRETLWREIAWRVNAGDDLLDTGWEPSPGLVANTGLFCGLWSHARRPYPLPCEFRQRRHTTRTFLPRGSWSENLPDTPGGDW